jgi:hypothetical protein
MRHLAVAIGAAAVLVTLAGCAQQGTAASGGSTLHTSNPPTSTSRPTATPVPGAPAMPGVHVPAGAVLVPGARVDAHSLPGTFPREVWTEHNGTVLGFIGEAGGCFTSRAVIDKQTDSGVTVRLIQQQGGTGEHACPMYVRYKPMSVTLAKPLGDRNVQLLMSIIRG